MKSISYAEIVETQRKLFPNFEHRPLQTPRGEINAMVGGSGPPLLLLHGYPESMLMWHSTAPLLSERHTVVTTDLAGYGASFRPQPGPEHRPHSKREMARDQVEAMAALGFDSFSVCGHDRGGRVAYRMALDHPDRVERVAVLDIVPTGEVWGRADAKLARLYWIWSFLSLPAPLPELLIRGNTNAYFEFHVQGQLGLGMQPGRYPEPVLDAYRRALNDPAAVEAICEDYRAGASVDVEDDDADRAAGRRIECPLFVLWGGRSPVNSLYTDVLDVWKPWAETLSGAVIEDATHFLVEDNPEETVDQLLSFF